MTEHDEAVQIARDALRVRGYLTTIDNVEAPKVVAALARADLLAKPGELASLRAVAEAAWARRGAQTGTDRLCRTQDLHDALDALDALDAAGAAGDASKHVCRSCGRPFSPWHDADAPGLTVRHIFTPTLHP